MQKLTRVGYFKVGKTNGPVRYRRNLGGSMANFYRLMLACCTFVFGGVVHAAFPPSANNWTILVYQMEGPFRSARAACDAYASIRNANSQDGFTVQVLGVQVSGNNGVCSIKLCQKNTTPQYCMETEVGTSSSGVGCPPNSVEANSQCSCDAGYFERKSAGGDTICVKPDDRTPDQLCEDAALEYNSTLQGSRFQRVKGALSAFADGALTCADVNGMPSGKGCKHWFTGDLGFKDDQGQSWVNGFSIALNKGDSRAGGSLVCNSTDGGTPPKEKPPPDDCKNGYKGQVNGVDVCVEAWTGDTEGNDWNRNTDGEGNHTDEKTNIKCKGDQCTVTQTKTTTKQDGTTTTTTTTTENVNRQGYCARNPESAICRRQDDTSGGDKGPATRPGGGKGGGDGSDGEGFCKENPESPICKKSNFGGSCAASFTCEGDAIQCAIAKEQHVRACKLFDDKSPESDLYEAEKAKDRNRDVTKDLPGNEEIDVSTRLSRANVLGASSCIGDLSVTVWRAQVTLPLSRICAALAQLGWILVAVSSIAAARIVTKT